MYIKITKNQLFNKNPGSTMYQVYPLPSSLEDTCECLCPVYKGMHTALSGTYRGPGGLPCGELGQGWGPGGKEKAVEALGEQWHMNAFRMYLSPCHQDR